MTTPKYRSITTHVSHRATNLSLLFASTAAFAAGAVYWYQQKDQNETVALAEEEIVETPSKSLPPPVFNLNKDSIYVLGDLVIPGRPDETPMLIPHQILTDFKPKTAAVGDADAFIIDQRGKLYTWTDAVSKVTPVLSGYSFKQIECGHNGFVAALQTNGSIWIRYDQNSSFQLIDKGDLKRKTVTKITVGAEHVSAITKDGKLYTLGSNTRGQCGIVELDQSPHDEPHLVPWEGKVVDVASGLYHTVAVTSDGGVFGFGYNKNLQIARQQEFVRYKLPSIPLVPFGTYQEMRSSEQARFAFKNWNDPEEYITQYARPNPELLEFFTKRNIKASKVVCGDRFTFVIDNTGTMYGFGDGSQGQLARKPPKNYVQPSRIHRHPFGNEGAANILEMSCGSDHCAALMKNGELFTWGYNLHGAVGTGNRVTSLTPVPILTTNTTPIKSVVCDKASTIVIL